MRNRKLIIIFSVLLSITLLVVLGSVIFSVQHVDTYCMNVNEDECADSREIILSSYKIRKGSSIFGVNESKVIANIEKNNKANNIRILNIERKFPNRVCINYVVVKPYFRFLYEGNTYYCYNDMRISSIQPIDLPENGLINLRFSGNLVESEKEGEFTFGPSKGLNAPEVLSEILSGFEQLKYYEEVIDLFYEIDLSGTFIKLYTRCQDKDNNDVRGMEWQILTPDNLADKLRLALSTYDTIDQKYKHVGYLKITGKRADYEKPKETVA